jgi:zinc D-Ala-D-Ala dipeptidase
LIFVAEYLHTLLAEPYLSRMRALLFLLYLIFSTACCAQDCKTEATYINRRDSLLASIHRDAGKQFVDLKQLIPDLVIDLRYSNANNFTHTVLYQNAGAYMRVEPALALKKVQAELKKQGLGIKIFDAYRPFAVTCKIWKLVADRRYVSNPRKGSNHNRGVAVDLTLMDLKTGKELDMGTQFDNFTDTAHHDFYALPPQVIANRRLLKSIMRKNGFNIVPTEWWHYQWVNRSGFGVVNLSFDDIRQVIRQAR